MMRRGEAEVHVLSHTFKLPCYGMYVSLVKYGVNMFPKAV